MLLVSKWVRRSCRHLAMRRSLVLLELIWLRLVRANQKHLDGSQYHEDLLQRGVSASKVVAGTDQLFYELANRKRSTTEPGEALCLLCSAHERCLRPPANLIR